MPNAPQPITIAIADDHPLFAQGLELLLNSQPGFSVVIRAANGWELLQFLRDHPVDLALLDYHMPVMDGLTACQQLARLHPRVKPVILSFNYNEELVDELKKAGVRGYLTKDIEPDLLREQLQVVAAGGEAFRPGDDGAPNGNTPVSPAPVLSHISTREKQITSLISKGLTSHEIADNLYISIHTVNQHRKNILSKLNLKNTNQLVAFAIRHAI